MVFVVDFFSFVTKRKLILSQWHWHLFFLIKYIRNHFFFRKIVHAKMCKENTFESIFISILVPFFISVVQLLVILRNHSKALDEFVFICSHNQSVRICAVKYVARFLCDFNIIRTELRMSRTDPSLLGKLVSLYISWSWNSNDFLGFYW